MAEKELEEIVREFLNAKPINFSEHWKVELINRLKRLKAKPYRQYVGTIHDDMLLTMMEEDESMFGRTFSSLSENDKITIIGNAKEKWFRYFDATKSAAKQPERSFYQMCLSQAESDWYREITKLKLDENGNSILDENGKVIREKVVPTLVFYENTGDTSDDTEELEQENESQLKTDFDKIHEVASDEKVDAEEEEGKLFEFAGKRFSDSASEEIVKYYLLSRRIKTNSKKYALPKIKTIYKPLKKSIPYRVKPEFDNLTDVSVNALNRLQYLKNSEKRKWMEMAISEMRKSKEKLDIYILKQKETNPAFDEIKFCKDTPILSSVVLNKSGKLVSTCFKGKVDTCHTNVRGVEKDVTFDNHCEFSLFTDVIKKENLHLILDGVLYVTLEPCNKRGFWLDGGKEEPKIPCAVRCLEAGLKKVFIGSIDDNNKVKNKGKEILESGRYVFNIKDGKLAGTEKEVKEEGLLEEYFKGKKYPYEEFNGRRVYQIGPPVEVHDFEPDLIEEVRRINSVFLHRYNESAFRV